MFSEKFLTRLMGRTEVEDAFERLDTLTKEETLMAVTRILGVTHHVDGDVTAVKGIVHNIDGNVEAIKEVILDVNGGVEVTKDVISNVDGNVKGTKELAENIDDNVKATKALTEVVGNNVKVIQGVARSVDHNVKATKLGTYRFLSVFIRTDPSQSSPKTVTEQLNLRTWLSAPEPSINHNTACKTQHAGTATWFIQSNTFRDWKKNGSLLWVHGNRTHLPSFLSPTVDSFPDFAAGAGKSILWYASALLYVRGN